jgi:hypothetical protein
MEQIQDPAPANGTEPAAKPAEPAATNGLYTLDMPLVLAGGKTIEKLNLDFRKIKAKAWLSIDKQFADQEKKFVALLWTDSRYQLMTVAKLNGLIYEDLLELSGGDFVTVTGAVKDFFTDRLKES